MRAQGLLRIEWACDLDDRLHALSWRASAAVWPLRAIADPVEAGREHTASQRFDPAVPLEAH